MESRLTNDHCRYRVGALVALLLFVAVPLIAVAGEKSTLVVTVLEKDGETPIANARVLITGPDDLERSGLTDSHGKAAFKELPQKKLTVQVVATGLEPHGEKIKLKDKVGKLTVKLTKSEALPAKATAEPAPPSQR